MSTNPQANRSNPGGGGKKPQIHPYPGVEKEAQRQRDLADLLEYRRQMGNAVIGLFRNILEEGRQDRPHNLVEQVEVFERTRALINEERVVQRYDTNGQNVTLANAAWEDAYRGLIKAGGRMDRWSLAIPSFWTPDLR